MTANPPPPGPAGRIPLVDAARGVALLAMAVYHFTFDLNDFGFVAVDVTGDPAWRNFARAIAATFLALVGVSLVLAARGGLDRRRYNWRLARIVAAACLVTLGTFVAVPNAFIYFGILHAIAVFSVAALPFLYLPAWVAVATAIACLAAPALFASHLFDAPWLLWLGLAESPRISVDYVPVLPWFAATLAGLAAGRWAVARGADRQAAAISLKNPLFRPFILAGRWSLLFYLLHQPVLIAVLALYARL